MLPEPAIDRQVARQQPVTLLGALEGHRVGPPPAEGLDKALGLAVGAGRVGPGADVLEVRFKAVRELPAETVPGEQIHDCHQGEESLLQRDVGDVGGPNLMHSSDCADIHQAGKALGRIPFNRGAGLLVDRP